MRQFCKGYWETNLRQSQPFNLLPLARRPPDWRGASFLELWDSLVHPPLSIKRTTTLRSRMANTITYVLSLLPQMRRVLRVWPSFCFWRCVNWGNSYDTVGCVSDACLSAAGWQRRNVVVPSGKLRSCAMTGCSSGGLSFSHIIRLWGGDVVPEIVFRLIRG